MEVFYDCKSVEVLPLMVLMVYYPEHESYARIILVKDLENMQFMLLISDHLVIVDIYNSL